MRLRLAKGSWVISEGVSVNRVEIGESSLFAAVNETFKLLHSFHLKQDCSFESFSHQLKEHKKAM